MARRRRRIRGGWKIVLGREKHEFEGVRDTPPRCANSAPHRADEKGADLRPEPPVSLHARPRLCCCARSDDAGVDAGIVALQTCLQVLRAFDGATEVGARSHTETCVQLIALLRSTCDKGMAQ